MKAKKNLGQHFLNDASALERAVEALGGPEGRAIEIGPGHGELTRVLLEAGWRVTAIEKDDGLADALGSLKDPSLEVVRGDALKALPEVAADPDRIPEGERYSIIGNIPYYITGKLLRVIGDLAQRPARTVLMVQEEVAERIVAGPPRMNLLAANIRAWSDPRIVFRIPKDAFVPRPKVDSAVVLLESKDGDELLDDHYHEFTRVLFKQPRKTVLNNLSDALGERADKAAIQKKLASADIPPAARPQDLTVAQISDLSGLFRP